jgi:transposase
LTGQVAYIFSNNFSTISCAPSFKLLLETTPAKECGVVNQKKKMLEKITVDRKIVEGLREGRSLTSLTKLSGKGKGYVIKIKDLAIEYGYVVSDDNNKIYLPTKKDLPLYPQALFPLRDGRSERSSGTDDLLLSKREWIKERLELGWSPQTIFEELPLSVPRSNFYRYLHRQNLMVVAPLKNVMELIHSPGECLQVDWGKLFDVMDPVTGKKKTIWIFIGILGHSRYEMARVVERLDFETTIEVLISMFDELGGVPRKVTSDNPRVFVNQSSLYEPSVNPAFERFASHYGFIVEALPPGEPSMKGKVERMVPMKRRLFESYDKSSYTLKSAQEHLNKKMEIVNERKHGTHLQKPIDVFLNDEVLKLKELPILRYEVESVVHSTVRADGYVRFLNKYYRVDIKLKGEITLVIGNSEQVSIYCGGRLLEVYSRITDPFITKACKDHYKEPWEKTLQDHGHYLRRAQQVGAHVERFISIILARGEGFVDTRVIWGILVLNKKYKNEDINRACESSLELSQVNLATVRQLLNIMAKPIENKNKIKNEEFSVQVRGGKFARPMSEYKNHLRLVYSNTK